MKGESVTYPEILRSGTGGTKNFSDGGKAGKRPFLRKSLNFKYIHRGHLPALPPCEKFTLLNEVTGP